MRMPWSKKPETRASIGGYTTIISQLIEAQAVGSTQQASATAAIEAAAGALSRAFASATVAGPDDVVLAVTPRVLAQIGRDLVRVGESLHVIRYMGGRLVLVPSSTWYWEGEADPASWLCTATAYGPSGSSTWRVPSSSVIFASWGSPAARPYHGLGPAAWAADSARLHANAERSLADEAGGPIGQLITYPQDTDGDGGDEDRYANLKKGITAARGAAMLVETTSAGLGEGRGAAPQTDYKPQRLGPVPPEAFVAVADAAFSRVLASCGASVSMFSDADGTAQRESLRRWFLNTVQPLAKMLEHELSMKLDSDIHLAFDGYARDLVSRATVTAKLAGVEGITAKQALQAAGLLQEVEDDD